MEQNINENHANKKFKLPRINLKSIKLPGRFFRKALPFVIVALLIGALYLFKGLFIAAVVNGKPVTRMMVVRNLERTYGSEMLDNQVTEILIEQEAKKENITVPQSEIDKQLASISDSLKSSQGTTLDEALKKSGMEKEELIRQIVLKSELQQILEKRVAVTPDEVEAFIKANKDQFPKDMTQDQITAQVTDEIKNQKMGQVYQTWLGEAKTQANIKYFVRYPQL